MYDSFFIVQEEKLGECTYVSRFAIRLPLFSQLRFVTARFWSNIYFWFLVIVFLANDESAKGGGKAQSMFFLRSSLRLR